MTVETPPAKIGRLDNVQALRGIAAILVVICHIADHQRRYMSPGTAEWEIARGFWDQGWIGVDLFFVISGYIMVHVTRDLSRGVSTAREFLYKRVTRIYPLWWLCSGFLATYFLISYGIPAAPGVMEPSESWLYVLKSLLLIPQAEWPNLGVGWTLIHEMFFYLIFTLILLFSRIRLVPALLIWAALTIASNLIFGSMPREKPVLLLITSLMSLEFIAGALLAVYMPRLLKKTGLGAMCWAAIVASCAFLIWAMIKNPIFLYSGGTNHISRTLLYALPFTLILGATTYLYLNNLLRIPSWLTRLGDWSYSLYLTHIIVLISLNRIIVTLEPAMPIALRDLLVVQGEGWGNNLFMAVVALLACVGVSALTYRLFERPVTRWFRRRRDRSPVQTSA